MVQNPLNNTGLVALLFLPTSEDTEAENGWVPCPGVMQRYSLVDRNVESGFQPSGLVPLPAWIYSLCKMIVSPLETVRPQVIFGDDGPCLEDAIILFVHTGIMSGNVHLERGTFSSLKKVMIILIH